LRVEYVSGNAAQSLVLFDASNQRDDEKGEVKDTSAMTHLPVIERSELTIPDKGMTGSPILRDLLSDHSEPPKRAGGASSRSRSKSPQRKSTSKNYYRSTQEGTNGHLGNENTFASSLQSNNALL